MPPWLTNLASAEIVLSFITDTLLVYRAGTGLRQLSKQTFIQNIPTVPIGAMIQYAGTSPPAGYLFCDGSEVRIGDFSALFGIIGYTYKRLGLRGKNTFALPDLRGRFPMGPDSMDNDTTVPDKDDPTILIDAGGGSANRVTATSADNIGESNGSEEISIQINNLPEHKHTLQSESGLQYFAGGSPTGAADGGTISGYGLSAGATGYGLPNSGGVSASRVGDSISTMNPYITINYIIFTGVLQ